MHAMPELADHLSTVAQVQCEKVQFHGRKEWVHLLWRPAPDRELVAIQLQENEHLIPSLTLCCMFPACVPVIVMSETVVPYIFNGAHLMAPGILGDLPNVPLDSIVGIAAEKKPSLVIGVGILKMDQESFQTTRKGKVVHMIHFLGDQLWSRYGPPKLPKVTALKPPSPPATPPPQPSHEPAQSQETLVMEAFLTALYRLPEFPVASSTLFSKYMQPVHRGIDFKHTPWRKMSKFLRAMRRDGVIELREGKQQHAAEDWILSANLAHDHFNQIVLPKRRPTQPPPQHASATTSPLQVVHYYQPTPAIQALFQATDRVHFTAAEVRAAVAAHVQACAAHVALASLSDSPLAALLPAGAPARVSIVMLCACVLHHMRVVHTLSSAPDELHVGAYAPVEIAMSTTRGGGKHVTRVRQPHPHFHPFSVHSLQLLCAARASQVGDDVIQVMGNQTKVLRKWVEREGMQNLVKFV